MARSWLLIAVLAACRIHFDDVTAPGDAPAADASGTARIRVVGFGAVTGPGGIACAGDCMVSISAPTIVTASPGEAQQLAQFCGAGATCEIMPGSDVTAVFSPAPITANRVFVSSTMVTQSGNGRAVLDGHCTTLATAAGLGGGPWIAFVSTAAEDAVARLSGSRGWVRVDGLPVLDQPNGIGLDVLPRGITLDERGAKSVAKFALTGSEANGRVATGYTCTDWTGVGTHAKGARPDSAAHYLGGSTTQSACTGVVYCFETGKSVQVNLVPPAFPVGRYVFVSNGFNGTSGVAGADAACQADATAAGLPGTYKAVLATTTQSALDHVGSLGGAWRRPDGASVTRTGLDAGNFTTSFSMTAAKVLTADFPAFGAVSLSALGTQTCGDWTDTTINQGIVIGGFRMSPYDDIYTSGCVARPVVCVQTQ